MRQSTEYSNVSSDQSRKWLVTVFVEVSIMMPLGGSPAIRAYANQFGFPNLKPFHS